MPAGVPGCTIAVSNFGDRKLSSCGQYCAISEARLRSKFGSSPFMPWSGGSEKKRSLTFAQLQKLPDRELMLHLQNGCDDALAVLFDRYHRLVLAIAARIVRNATEAEDVMQTVFLDVYRAKVQFDPCKGSVKVWLLQYAYHRSFNRRQQLSRRDFYHQGAIQDLYDEGRPATPLRSRSLPPPECS